jgi:hypothetical protein
MSIEGIISSIIVVIVYMIVAAFVFMPIYNIMAPTIIACAENGYGTIATTLIMIAVFVIVPLLLVATMVSVARPRTEYVQ